MKMHLPHGLRAALMAAIATVSLTAAYGASPIPSDANYAIAWPTRTPDYTISPTGTSGATLGVANAGKYTLVQNNGKSCGAFIAYADRSATTTAPTYVKAENIAASTVRGTAWGSAGTPMKVGGSVYLLWSGTNASNVTAVYSTDDYSSVKGDMYVELANKNLTYTGMKRDDMSDTYSVLGALNSSIDGKNTIVIQGGKFEGTVMAGINATTAGTYSIGNGTYLQINGGTFNRFVVAGNSPASTSSTVTINGGTHLLIKSGETEPGPTFNYGIVGGSNGPGKSTINGGVSVRIEGGTINDVVYGGSNVQSSTINGGIDLAISGGTFNKIAGKGSGIYAMGWHGTVTGDVNLTISGDTAQFADNLVITAGSFNDNVTYSGGVGTVTLKDISSTTKNSLATNASIKLDGGKQNSTLVMNNVDSTIKAQLSRFSTMRVTNGSDLTLDSTNANLGGVSSISVDGGSTLNLSGTRADNVEMTVAADSTLNITGGSVGNVANFGNTSLSGNITLEGLVQNSGTLSITDGTTINVDELTLLHDATFKDGETHTKGGNGFLVEGSVCLATGGAYTINMDKVNVSLDGVIDKNLGLSMNESKTELHVSGLAEKEANTYFVNQGEVTHKHIQEVAANMGREVNTIAVESKLVSNDNTDTAIHTLVGEGTLAKTGDGNLTVTDAKDFSGDMEVSGGTLQVEDADLMQMHKERKITVSNRAVANLTKLTTGATVKALDLDGTLGVYTGETADEGNVGSLTVTGALTVSGEGSKLEANLTLDSGSIFDVSAGYSLELGCTLTMNDNLTIVLSDTQKTALAAGSAVELMTGVDALTGTLPKNFTIQDYDGPEAQFVYSGTTLSLSQTPEPTTTTLSLLALAALAARRKRK